MIGSCTGPPPPYPYTVIVTEKLEVWSALQEDADAGSANHHR